VRCSSRLHASGGNQSLLSMPSFLHNMLPAHTHSCAAPPACWWPGAASSRNWLPGNALQLHGWLFTTSSSALTPRSQSNAATRMHTLTRLRRRTLQNQTQLMSIIKKYRDYKRYKKIVRSAAESAVHNGCSQFMVGGPPLPCEGYKGQC
jgi:hypothetical protein